VRRFSLTQQFLKDFRRLEPGMSPADQASVDALLAAIVARPERPDRVQTFSDPARPSWLVRADPFVVHYAFDPDGDEVQFLNLFRRR
jgi:hypothetical protein